MKNKLPICQTRRDWLLKRFAKVTTLYPNLKAIYGPYLCSDGRYRVLIYQSGSKRTTRQFAKLKMELKLGRQLHPHRETVDHINDDATNDKYSNLQILTRKRNVGKAHATGSSSTRHLVAYSRSERGRRKSSARQRGENNINSCLRDVDVIKLRKAHALGTLNRKEACARLNLSDRSFRNMLTGATYSHLPFARKLKRGRPRSC
jgi:hypothetical protein